MDAFDSHINQASPYPLIYCPPGVEKPLCCPHMGCIRQAVGGGPDQLGGMIYGGAYVPNAGEWKQTRSGWWLNLNGHVPQNLIVLEPSPRVMRWRTIVGAHEDHHWRIPVLLTLAVEGDKNSGFVSALDRIWQGKEWEVGADLKRIQEPLQSIVNGIKLSDDIEVCNELMAKLAIDLLSVGHWVDADFIAAAGWLSEILISHIVIAACDLVPESELSRV